MCFHAKMFNLEVHALQDNVECDSVEIMPDAYMKKMALVKISLPKKRKKHLAKRIQSIT